MSEIPLSPSQEERKVFRGLRSELVILNDRIVEKAVTTFATIQPFDDFKTDPGWEPILEYQGEEPYYSVASKWVLIRPREIKLEGEELVVKRYMAARLSLGYRVPHTEAESQGRGLEGLSAMLRLVTDRLDGREAIRWRREFTQSDRLPQPDKIDVRLAVLGTGDDTVDNRVGGSTLDSRTVSGASIPVLNWGKVCTYFKDDADFLKIVSLQDIFLTEEMIDTHETRMLFFDDVLGIFQEALEDKELNPRE